MAEDLKEKIYQFLKDNAGKRFNILEVKRQTNLSYNTCLKWISVLVEEKDRDPPVTIQDYGNVKLVGIEKESGK